jgi:hypothetical protein
MYIQHSHLTSATVAINPIIGTVPVYRGRAPSLSPTRITAAATRIIIITLLVLRRDPDRAPCKEVGEWRQRWPVFMAPNYPRDVRYPPMHPLQWFSASSTIYLFSWVCACVYVCMCVCVCVCVFAGAFYAIGAPTNYKSDTCDSPKGYAADLRIVFVHTIFSNYFPFSREN